jgi:hypothetical protein
LQTRTVWKCHFGQQPAVSGSSQRKSNTFPFDLFPDSSVRPSVHRSTVKVLFVASPQQFVLNLLDVCGIVCSERDVVRENCGKQVDQCLSRHMRWFYEHRLLPFE